ncbi:MAG TPA: HAMP domain-containing sensor histidine kinase [Thermoanaerobaculia bacterium]|nr:HAMP domain-containing sensor histidine kinase [Thermoanaerobaculia bacterium]
MKPAEGNRRSIWRVGPESTWTTVVPVVFIIASLLSLVILPLVVRNKTARMRAEITSVAEPARRAANQIQVDLAGELDQIIAYQFTGQGQYRTAFYKLVESEESKRRDLMTLLPRLRNDDLGANLTKVFVQSSRWHDAVRRGEFVERKWPAEVFLARLFEAHAAYESSLDAASDLELELQLGIESRLRRIREADRLNLSITIILSALALISAMLVAGLGRQMRLLAREAMRRRQEAERDAAEAKTARATAEREERRTAFLAAVGDQLAASLDYEQTIHSLARLIVPNLAEMCVVDMTDSEGTLRRATIAHRNPEDEATLAPMVGSAQHDIPEPLIHIIRSGEPALVGATSPLFAYVTGVRDGGTRTLVFLPLVSRGQTIGIVGAVSPASKPFTSDDLPLFLDLSRRASLAIDNARLYLESQQAVRAREEVLAIVSHDLRNPLSAITLGSSLLLESETLSGEDREQIETMQVSAQRMNRLIADLLDVTRLEGGKRLPIEPAPVSVNGLLTEAQELFRAQAAVAGVSIEADSRRGVEAVFADHHRVMQVLSNLIGNSLKFTPPGGTIRVSAEPHPDGVLFTIADTGPGIPKEHIGHIFTPYWQAKRAERLGAGLGLAIVKGIVESHGGEIWAESQPGQGTQFRFTLPAAQLSVSATEESSARY